MKKALELTGFVLFVFCVTACSVLQKIEDLPTDSYSVSSTLFRGDSSNTTLSQKRVKAILELEDSTLIVIPEISGMPSLTLNVHELRDFKFYRRTFDIDVLTIPFKIRPSVQGFPTQLNPNFNAALYLGRRLDYYHTTPVPSSKMRNVISGLGVGYGGFIGLGSVTMNPFVTQQAIDYDYEGFVITGGAAAIYDAKRFNLGVALGGDFLADKNRESWIYHKKPWLGILFGINLN